jgi:tetratricopeptide (TPR) repeat protein
VLHHCHGRNVVHRDVKPANVLIERGTDRPVLVDFGVIKQGTQHTGGQRLSMTGEMHGTPAYMAPEQADRHTFGEVGPPTDVYGLGATLYHLLCGEPPFSGEATYNVITSVITKPAVDPREHRPDVPAPLAELCLRALSKVPAERPASCQALAAALDAWLDQAPVSTKSRHVAPLAAGGVAFALLLALGLWAFLAPLPGERPDAAELAGPPGPDAVDDPPRPDGSAAGDGASPEDPQDPGPDAALQRELARAFLKDADRFWKEKKHPQAISAYSDALAHDLDTAERVRALTRRAYSYRYSDPPNPGASLEDATQALALDPTHAQAQFEQAKAHYDLEDRRAAAAGYEATVKLDPNHYWGWQNLGHVRRKHFGDLHGSIAAYSEAIRCIGNRERSWRGRGYARYLLGRNKVNPADLHEAIKDLRRALEIDPKSYQAHLDLGLVYEALELPESALKEYNAAAALRPKNGKPELFRGRLYRQLLRFEEAKVDLEESLRLLKDKDRRKEAAWMLANLKLKK